MMTKKKTVKGGARARFKKAKAKEDELFAILGRYIQEFERVVSTMRNDCAVVVMGKERGIALEQGIPQLAHDAICTLAFHHQVMTAQPIAELWCGLICEQTRADMNLSQEMKEVIYGVANTITGDFKKLIATRNQLLHAGWSIGPWYTPETFEFQFSVTKFKSGQRGLEKRDDLPANSSELSECWHEIKKLNHRLSNFNSLRRHGAEYLVGSYTRKKDRWEERKS